MIRMETEADRSAIRELTRTVFAASSYGHHGEAELVDHVRAGCPATLSLVAELDGEVVGHALFSPVRLLTATTPLEGMGLGPMAVAIERQGQGIGTSLVTFGLDHLKNLDCPFVVVLGDPKFYGRCAFRPASELGIGCQFPGIPEEAFQIVVLNQPVGGLPAGTIEYRPEFSKLE